MGNQASLHPTDQTLGDFGLGRLDDGSADSVNRHLEECADCQRRVAEMSGDSFLGRLRDAHGSNSATGRPPTSAAPRVQKPAVPPPDTMPPGLADHPDYEVVRELGRGGMGVVYLAQNRLMGRLEVLKVVGGHLVERPGVRDRFLREIQSAARLQHKNIVAAYSALRLGDGIVLAMEYVEGDDLAKLVKTGGPLPVANACYFIYQAALGLQHAHERGMVHRDIKPANLILAKEGKKAVVKVLDFGLAKVTSEGQADSGLTREGQMLGTPDYIAPEQIRDAQKADIRADIYSLGCTFYYLLTGRAPFHGDNLWDLYQAHFSMDASPLNLVRPDVPVELAALVAKMLAKEPNRRFQTPGEVARELTRFFKPASPQSTGSSPEIPVVDPPATAISTPLANPAPAPFQPTPPIPKQGKDGVVWESLIEFKETERSKEAIAPVQPETSGPNRRPPWVALLATLAAAGFAGLLFGIIIYFRSDKDGTKLVVKTTPENAVATPSHEERQVATEKAPEITPAPTFVPLFNGKDLTGWDDDHRVTDAWKVTDGTIVGRVAPGGLGLAVLHTQRQNFTNFRLRIKYRRPAGRPWWIMLRHSEFWNARSNDVQQGYLVTDGGKVTKLNGYRYGFAFPKSPEVQHTVPTRADDWNLLEVEAVENMISTSLNGDKVTEFRDDVLWHPAGDIALTCSIHIPIEIQEVSLQELPAPRKKGQTPASPRKKGQTPAARKKGQTPASRKKGQTPASASEKGSVR